MRKEWKTKKLKQISERIKGKNKGKSDNVLTISAQHGLVSQLEYFNKSVASKNLDGYYFLEKGDFAYNKSYSEGYPLGAIKMLEKYDVGVVSTLYICFRMNESENIDFFRHYFSSSIWHNEVMSIAPEGGRSHGLLNVGVKDFFEINLTIPPPSEQNKISEILNTVDNAIEKTEAIIEQTEKLKKGLMQQLLYRGIGHSEFKKTEIGEIPLDWEIKKLDEVVERIIGGGTPSRKIDRYYKGTIPWVTVKDLKYYKIDNAIEHITEEAIKNSATNLIPSDNIIVATRMAVGKAFKNLVDVTINQDLKALIPNKELIISDFLLWSYLEQSGKISKLGTGTTVMGIRLEQLRDIKIALPPMGEQLKIVKILETSEEKVQSNKLNLQALKTIKKGLMQNLLTGKIRVIVDKEEVTTS